MTSLLVPPPFTRRDFLSRLAVAATATSALPALPRAQAAPGADGKDSLPMQFYKSLTEQQRAAICLPVNHEIGRAHV